MKTPPAKILPSACTAMAWTVTVRVRVERISQAGRGIEPGDVVARLSADAVRPLKEPPTKILPSACTAMERTVLFAFGSNESAKPVVASSRAMRLRVCPPMLSVKSPPAKILPSACTAMEKTEPFAFGSNESARSGGGIEPGDAVARLSADAVVKKPPTKILPSACTAMELTKSFAFGLKAVSSVPSGFKPGDAVARDRRSAVGRERGKIAADKNLAVRLDDDDANRDGFQSNPSARVAPFTQARPVSSMTKQLQCIFIRNRKRRER